MHRFSIFAIVIASCLTSIHSEHAPHSLKELTIDHCAPHLLFIEGKRCGNADGAYATQCAAMRAECNIKSNPQKYWKEYLKIPSDSTLYKCISDVAGGENICQKLDISTKITASDELDSQESFDYKASNLLTNSQDVWAAHYNKGVTLTIDVQQTSEIYGIAITNGYIRTDDAYKNNSRVKSISIFANDQKIGDYELGDVPDYDDIIDFSKPLKDISKIKITINSVYKGDKWNDVCITRIYIIGGK